MVLDENRYIRFAFGRVKQLEPSGQFDDLGGLRGPATTVATASLGLPQLVGLGIGVCVYLGSLLLETLIQTTEFFNRNLELFGKALTKAIPRPGTL